VRLDPVQLRQVFNNLIINSGDAMHETTQAPRVTITTRLLETAGRDWVRIGIEDNGPGFPESLLDRIFDPYVTTKRKGTGLGLAIVHRIVEEHGGRIRAETLSGSGAMIEILLPLDSGSNIDSEGESSTSHPARASENPARVLS
jgi:nitrogen fixation/metabolism regulation signal transduction histidine kinase